MSNPLLLTAWLEALRPATIARSSAQGAPFAVAGLRISGTNGEVDFFAADVGLANGKRAYEVAGSDAGVRWFTGAPAKWKIVNDNDDDLWESDEDVATPDLVTNWVAVAGQTPSGYPVVIVEGVTAGGLAGHLCHVGDAPPYAWYHWNTQSWVFLYTDGGIARADAPNTFLGDQVVQGHFSTTFGGDITSSGDFLSPTGNLVLSAGSVTATGVTLGVGGVSLASPVSPGSQLFDFRAELQADVALTANRTLFLPDFDGQLLVNGWVEPILATLGIDSYANLATANAAIGEINRTYYDQALTRLNQTDDIA